MTKYFLIALLFSFTINANCQTADFTFTAPNGLFCVPSAVTFTQNCTGNPKSFVWDFGNNNFGSGPVASFTFAAAGTYTVKLIAIFERASLSVTKTVTVNPVVTAAINADKNYICQPGSVNFTGSGSGNITKYEWDFGDGSPVSSSSANTISHSFASYATNSVTLTVTDASGCTGAAKTSIDVKKLPISLTYSRTNGCIPATVNFAANVTLPTGSSVTNYTWDYGDGSPQAVSPGNTSSHIYTAAGDFYYTILNVTTSEGCTNSFKSTRLYFGTQPFNTIAFAKDTPVCASDSVVFVSKATDANGYYWNFGDGTTINTTDTIIKHKYKTVGTKSVSVHPFYNQCLTPTNFQFKVPVIGVVANFGFSNTCSAKDTYLFTDSSSGIPTSSLWTFGDGNQQANITNPVNTFPPAGQFSTKLFLSDNVTGCTDSISKVIYTASPSVANSDSAVCINTPNVHFTIAGNYTNPNAHYTWNALGTQFGYSPNFDVIIPANKLGSFYNYVIIDNGPGTCLDTITSLKPVLVNGPQLDFTLPASVCLKVPVVITNNSKPYMPVDAINTWYWNYGNFITNDSVYQPAPINYAAPTLYIIKLTAIDINGCKDVLTKQVIVKPIPFLQIASASDTLCYGLSDSLIAFHNGDLLWSPGTNLLCTACDTTVATPLLSTTYYATATNTAGCSIKDSAVIKVSEPFTMSVNPAEASFCQGQSTTVDVLPKGKKILWSPATGLSGTTIYNPVISPAQSTLYTVQLTDSLGCSAVTATVNVIIKSLPLVDAGADAFYPKGASYTFAPTYGNNVSTYSWSPSGLLSCNNCAFPNGIAERSQTYVLQVTSDSGCIAKDSVTIFIECKSSNLFMPAAFSPNNDNLNDVYYPLSIGIKSITKFIIYNRSGKVMFEAKNFSPNSKSFGWDGRLKGADQSVGSYVYVLEALCDIGEKLVKKGSFILVR